MVVVREDQLSLAIGKEGQNARRVCLLYTSIKPLIKGGEQEKDRRAGTSFTMGAYSMAKSFPKACSEREKIKELKSYFVKKLRCV